MSQAADCVSSRLPEMFLCSVTRREAEVNGWLEVRVAAFLPRSRRTGCCLIPHDKRDLGSAAPCVEEQSQKGSFSLYDCGSPEPSPSLQADRSAFSGDVAASFNHQAGPEISRLLFCFWGFFLWVFLTWILLLGRLPNADGISSKQGSCSSWFGWSGKPFASLS